MQLLIREGTRRGVAYLSFKGAPIATCFFVDVPWGERGNLTYAITARHVLEGLSDDDKLNIEFSTTAKGYSKIATKATEWICSDVTDLACRRMPYRDDLIPIHIVRFLRPQSSFREGEFRLQCGMDVYMVGLFVKSPYRDIASEGLSVEPIVRFGKISLEDTEVTVQDKIVRAILVESISFEGESGSPVFRYLEHADDRTTITRNETRKDLAPSPDPPLVYQPRQVRFEDGQISTPLIGMISSHWKVDAAITNKRRKVAASVGLNSGIAVVIPSDDIREFLMNDSMVEKEREDVPKPRLNHPASPLSARVQEEPVNGGL